MKNNLIHLDEMRGITQDRPVITWTAGNGSTEAGGIRVAHTLLGAKRAAKSWIRDNLPNGIGIYRVKVNGREARWSTNRERKNIEKYYGL